MVQFILFIGSMVQCRAITFFSSWYIYRIYFEAYSLSELLLGVNHCIQVFLFYYRKIIKYKTQYIDSFCCMTCNKTPEQRSSIIWSIIVSVKNRKFLWELNVELRTWFFDWQVLPIVIEFALGITFHLNRRC